MIMRTIKVPADFTGYLMFRSKQHGASVRVWVGKDYHRLGYRPDGGATPIDPAISYRPATYGRPEHWAVQVPGVKAWWNLQQGEGIYGRFVKEKVCDGRCMSAIGPSCDCSCGGTNHGAGHGVRIEASA